MAAGLPEVIYTSDDDRYLHLPGLIVAESAAGELRYLMPDGLGSIRQAVDSQGQVTVYHEFDPYGSPVETGGDPYGFTGEWWEEEVALLHLRARWYAPGVGVFLSRDPVEGEPPYAYVRGNPVNLTDPSGYQAGSNVCDDWGYPFKIDCESIEAGDLEIAELFYRVVVLRNYYVGLRVSGDLLAHYLSGTTTPGVPYYIYDREWILSENESRNARKHLLDYYIDNEIKPAFSNQCHSGTVIRETRLRTDNTVAAPFGTDVRGALGNFYLNAYLSARLYTGRETTIDVTFMVKDDYDFDPQLGISVYQFGIGFVPHRWLVNLRDTQRAAEFVNHVIWTEQLTVDSQYNIRRIPSAVAFGIPERPPTPKTDQVSFTKVQCPDCQAN